MQRILVVVARLPWFVVAAALLVAWTALYAAWSLTVILVKVALAPLSALAALFHNERPSMRWLRDAVAEPCTTIPQAWERRIGWLLALR